MIITITDNNFEAEVLASDQPVVVKFWGEWCGPSRRIADWFDGMSNELANEAKFVQVEANECPNLFDRLGVRQTPTLVVFREGEIVASHVGVIPRHDLRMWVRSSI